MSHLSHWPRELVHNIVDCRILSELSHVIYLATQDSKAHGKHPSCLWACKGSLEAANNFGWIFLDVVYNICKVDKTGDFQEKHARIVNGVLCVSQLVHEVSASPAA